MLLKNLKQQNRNNKMIKKLFPVLSCFLFILSELSLYSQNQTTERLAHQYFQEKEFLKAAELYEQLYEKKPSTYFYRQYIQCLFELGENKTAEKFIKKEFKKNPDEPYFNVDIGYLYQLEGDANKANKHYASIINNLKADRNKISNTANAFISRALYSHALETYKKGKDLPRISFEAKKLFYDLIGSFIKENGLSVLNKMGNLDVNTIDFLETKLDLVINNKKKNKRGKGYKAYTNSVLLLLFRKFVEEKSANKIGLFMFDSPLKNLSIPEEIDDDTNNIRKGFFDYIINLKTDDQIIIFENTKHLELPQLDENEDTKIYIFTQKENSGRYGFLNGVKKA